MSLVPTLPPTSPEPRRPAWSAAAFGEVLAKVAEFAPTLIIICRKADLSLAYLNGEARQALDPEGHSDLTKMGLPDFVGVSSASHLKGEILLHAELMGKWKGTCVLRDVWGSEFPVSLACTYDSSEKAGAVFCIHALKLTKSAEGAEPGVSSDHELLHALMETLPDAVYFKDRQSRFIRANVALARKKGYASPEALVGLTDFDHFTIEHAQRAYDDEQKIMRTGEPLIELEEMETWPDGRISWVSSTKLPLRNLQGQIVGTYGISRDITGRKKGEEEMRKLSRIIEQAPLSVAITDLTGAIEYINPMFTQISGYTLADVKGKNPRLLKSGATPPEVYRDMWQTLHTGQIWRGELSNRTKSGEIFVENAVIAPVVDDKGQATHFVALKENITAHKRTEAALQESQERYQLIAENTADVIWLYDLAREQFTYVSAAVFKLRGFTAEEVVGQSMRQVLTPASADLLARQLPVDLAAFAAGDTAARTRISEVDQWHKDGSTVPTEVVTTLLTDVAGRPDRLLGVSRNITERKRIEKEHSELLIQLQLAQKLEAIGGLAAGIAHEINTPTQFITDNTHFLTNAFGELAQLQEAGRRFRKAAAAQPVLAAALKALAAVEQEIDYAYLQKEIPNALKQNLEGLGRVARIVQSLKEFSHPQNAQRNSTDLNHVISTAITVSRHEWKYVAEVVTDFAQDLPPVPCVVDQFNQVLLNLLVNAAHAIEAAHKAKPDTAQLGKITVRTRQDGDWALVEVEDTGTGIPEKILPHIFEPFFTTKEIGKGTGQGLSIVHTVIVKKHQGTINVTTQPGRGSTFHLRLPLRVPADPANL